MVESDDHIVKLTDQEHSVSYRSTTHLAGPKAEEFMHHVSSM